MKIFFDLDGTLIDVSKRHHTVYTQLVGKFGGKPLAKDEYWKLKQNRLPWPDMLEKSGIHAAKLEAFMAEFIALIESPDMLAIDAPFSFVPNVLEQLKGSELYLITLRRNNDNVVQQLKDLGLYNSFTKVVSGHTENEGHELKTKLIKDLCDKNSIVVGDTESDILAAKANHITSVAVLSGIRDKNFLASLGPDYIISDIGELPKLLNRL